MNRFADNVKNMSIAAKASILLGLFVLILCGMIWPGGVLTHSTETKESVSNPHKESEPLFGDLSLEGKFVGLGGHMKSLGFLMAGVSSGNGGASGSAAPEGAASTGAQELPALLLTVFDESGAELYSGGLPYNSLKNNEYAEFPVDFDTVRAETYSYSLSFSGAGSASVSAESGSFPEAPRVQLGSEDSLPEEELFGWYAAAPQFALYPLMSFTYEAAPTLQSALPYWMVILFAFALVLGALGIFRTKAAPFLAVFFVCFYACAFLCLTDEGKTPVRLTGRELENLTGNHDYDYVGISERADLAGTMAKTKDFTLNPGTYVIGVGYGTDTSLNTVSVTDNGSYIAEYTLDASEGYREFELELPKGSQFFTVSFNYCGQGYFIVNSFSLAPRDRFYTDNLLLILFTVILGIGLELSLFWKQLRKTDDSDKNDNSAGAVIPTFAVTLFLIALAIFAMHPYFMEYLPYGDDVCYHLIRIEGTKDGLLSGQFPVVLYPEGANAHGYLGWMYPSLFLYLPALLRIFGASTSLAWKTLVFCFHLLTAVTTYLSVKAVTRSKAAGLFSSVLYVLAPYRLCCFIARAALGEALAFAFFPLLFAGLYLTLYGESEGGKVGIAKAGASAGDDAKQDTGEEKAGASSDVVDERKTARGKQGWLYLALGLTGLLQTHILSCLMGLIFCVVFGVVRIRYVFEKDRLLRLCKAAALTVILNLWYLVPFLDFYLHAGLSTDSLAWSKYSEYSLLPVSVFGTFTAGDYRMYALGVPLLLAFGAYIALRVMGRLKKEEFFDLCSVLAAVCFVLALCFFPARSLMASFPALDALFTNLQFPWRLLGVVSFLCALLGGEALFGDSRNMLRVALGVALIVLAVAMVPRYDTANGDYYAYPSYDAEYTEGHYMKLIGIPKAKHTIVYPYEWMPDGAGEAEALGAAEVAYLPDMTGIVDSSYVRNGLVSQFEYVVGEDAGLTGERWAVLPLFAYEGYEAVDETGAFPSVMTRNEGGLLQVPLSNAPGVHYYTVTYKAPASVAVGGVLSIVGLIAFVAVMVFIQRRGKLR